MIEDDRILSCGNIRRYLKKQYSPIPDRYNEIEYVKNDGNNWIDTGIVPNQTIKLQFGVTCNGTTGGAIIGTTSANDNIDYRIFNYTNYWYYDFKDQRCIDTQHSVTLGKKYSLELGNNYIKDLDTNTILVSGNTVSSYSGPSSIALFQGTDGAIYFIYFVKIWLNDELVLDYIPCIDTESENGTNVGFYDLVSKNFKYGTGNFVAGPLSNLHSVKILDTNVFDDRPANINYLSKILNEISFTISSNSSIKNKMVNAYTFKKYLNKPPYTSLSYIHLDGQAFLITDYVPNKNTHVVMDANVTYQNDTYAFFGSREGKSSYSYILWYLKSHFRYDYGKSNGSSSDMTNFGGRHTIETDKNTFSIDNQQLVATSNYNSINVSRVLAIGSVYSGSSNADSNGYDTRRLIADIYSFKIYEDTVLLRNYIPVKMDTGEIGLYDLINKNFLGNSGTGSITAGPEL